LPLPLPLPLKSKSTSTSEKLRSVKDQAKVDQALRLVVDFFRDKRFVLSTVVVPMLTHRGELPLHLVNWVASKYAKKVPVCYWIDEQGRRSASKTAARAVFVDVCKSFNEQVDAFGSEGFAAFRKQESRVFLEFEQPDLPPLETAVCQLNFFRWAWLYGVLDFCLEHFGELMTLFMQHKEQRRERKSDATASLEAQAQAQPATPVPTLVKRARVKPRAPRLADLAGLPAEPAAHAA
jgi:hypothetical protein